MKSKYSQGRGTWPRLFAASDFVHNVFQDKEARYAADTTSICEMSARLTQGWERTAYRGKLVSHARLHVPDTGRDTRQWFVE